MELSPRAKVFNAIAVVILFYLVIIGTLALPVIRGQCRYNEFTEQVSLNMTRDRVYKIAEDIGNITYDREVVGKGLVENTAGYRPDEMVDVFYFEKLLFYDEVTVHYDASDRVAEIEIEID